MNLAKFRLVLGDGNAGAVENDETGTRCTLVNGADETFLQIGRMVLLVLQDGAIAIVCHVRSHVDLEFQICRGLGVPVHAVFVEIKRVAHYDDVCR